MTQGKKKHAEAVNGIQGSNDHTSQHQPDESLVAAAVEAAESIALDGSNGSFNGIANGTLSKSQKKRNKRKLQSKAGSTAVAAVANEGHPEVATLAKSKAMGPPPSRDRQKEIVKQLLQQADRHGLQVGEKRFVIPSKWWERWKSFVNFEDEDEDDAPAQSAPPRINNEPLLIASPEYSVDELMGRPLRPQLREDYHYTLVPEEVWDALVCWFQGGPTIARFVVEAGDVSRGKSYHRVEVYPELAEKEKEEMLSEPAPVKTTTQQSKINAIVRKSTSLSQRKCAACGGSGLKRCGNCKSVWYCGAPCQHSHWRYHKLVCKEMAELANDGESAAFLDDFNKERRGKMGLRNLGNTCFMNSALQCLSHTEVLTKHFLSNKFEEDLNIENPLGTGGNLAREYDQLLKELWFGDSSYATPAGLKRAIGRFAPQFSGFQQHDSQELLAYMLDGLHEDLNRVKKKPYIEAKESDGRPDAIVAEEAWRNHLKRNRSIFVDHIQGQFKSTVVCPECSKVSITFDPFNCIQLELPMQTTRLMEVILVRVAPSASQPVKRYPMRFVVEVPKNGSVSSIKRELSSMTSIPSNRMIMADIFNNTTYRVIGDTERVARIREEDRLVVYEMRESPKSHFNFGFVYHRTDLRNVVGDPILLSFTADTTCVDFVKRLSDALAQLILEESREANRIPEQVLAQHVYLCDRDGALKRREPIPCDTTLLSDYVMEAPEEWFFFCLEWSGNIASSYRPELDSVVDHESVKKKQDLGSSRGHITLDQCFEKFTKSEKLDVNNLWYCSHCKEHRQAVKTMQLWKLPDVLILSLKRFEYRNEVIRDKLDVYVDFPIENLDMRPYCLQEINDPLAATYDLYAVSNHYGGMGFGHYTAFAKGWNDQDRYPGWFSFDDSSVAPVSSAQVKSNAAYILFYKRKSL